MAAETIGNPPSLSKRLVRQWMWAGIGFAIIVLVIVVKSADLDVHSPELKSSCQVEVNADTLNVRAGPAADAAVVDHLSRGEVVAAQPEVSNGYRKLKQDQWVATQFVTAKNDHC